MPPQLKDFEARRSNLETLQSDWLAALNKVPREVKAIEFSATGCAENSRQLATISFFADGDVAGFHRHLFAAAICKLFYLTKILEASIPHDPDTASRTEDLQFFDALAAQQLSLARAFPCYEAPPDEEWDDEEKARFVLFLQGCVHAPLTKAAMYKKADVDGWIKGSGGSSMHAVCRAIADKDGKGLAVALKGLVADREAMVKNNDPLPWEFGFVHIEALGILWLARQSDIVLEFEHQMTPRELQLPHRHTFTTRGLPSLNAQERQHLCDLIAEYRGKDFDHPYIRPDFLA